MKFIKILPVRFYREQSGNEPVRKWLRELSDEDRHAILKLYKKIGLQDHH